MLPKVISFVLQDLEICLERGSRKVFSGLLITQWFWSPDDLVLWTEQSCQKILSLLRDQEPRQNLQALSFHHVCSQLWHLLQSGIFRAFFRSASPWSRLDYLQDPSFLGWHCFVLPLRLCPHFISISAAWQFWCCREADFHTDLFLNHLTWFSLSPSE